MNDDDVEVDPGHVVVVSSDVGGYTLHREEVTVTYHSCHALLRGGVTVSKCVSRSLGGSPAPKAVFGNNLVLVTGHKYFFPSCTVLIIMQKSVLCYGLFYCFSACDMLCVQLVVQA